jgi:hypothetical protein
MQRIIILKLLSAALALVGCASPSALKEKERQATIEAAKLSIIDSGLVTNMEQQSLETKGLEINYYMLAKPYADYQITWDINGKEEILIEGRGDILKLEGSTINRREVGSNV